MKDDGGRCTLVDVMVRREGNTVDTRKYRPFKRRVQKLLDLTPRFQIGRCSPLSGLPALDGYWRLMIAVALTSIVVGPLPLSLPPYHCRLLRMVSG